MLSPLKHVLEEYRPLLMKMVVDSTIVTLVANNVDQLCDVQVMLDFA
jgi:hypothetical protein